MIVHLYAKIAFFYFLYKPIQLKDAKKTYLCGVFHKIGSE
ncbi:hypothetical protein HMPREF9441_03813 [Paraprevotella clara YIT 11840]|uniref:Uncharacterized protein n=1 Tax=Paraprevotella clara YIT 11840 TaxID=762968 RepID=G5SWP0_9BACT|nr:hypothetical protein HMPREF9441_03813 [Paraprevotella clara YIT 11840]